MKQINTEFLFYLYIFVEFSNILNKKNINRLRKSRNKYTYIQYHPV